jgi:hypothetical protein
MSMFSEPNQTPVSAADRILHSLILASFIERRRKELSLTVERAAALAGIELSQWYALECGWVPADRSVLRAVADTLQVCYVQISFLAEVSESNQSVSV